VTFRLDHSNGGTGKRLNAFISQDGWTPPCCADLQNGTLALRGVTTENTTMQQLYLGIFVAAMIALVVCGCILTRKSKKRLPTLRAAVPEERQRRRDFWATAARLEWF
jgi:hypothetical protein